MSLKIGIVGLPNVGKSTLFQALTKKEVDISNYPFCTIEPNIGVVEVPDERVLKLSSFFHSKKTIPAIVEFVDIAGLVRGASTGEGLGNTFLSHIRDVDAILYVVRFFENADIIHVEKTVDPIRDIDIIVTELLIKDADTVWKRKEKVEKDSRSGNKDALTELSVLKDLSDWIGGQKTAHSYLARITAGNEEKVRVAESLHLLTAKPALFAVNTDEEDIPEALKNKMRGEGGEYLLLNIKSELEGRAFTFEEKKELGIPESKLDILIKKSYEILNLITFFTTGEDETRAWTIQNGTFAPRAAGVIHSDFEKKFIRADIINWKDLLDAGGWPEAKSKGILRTEGKEYQLQDGDIIEVKHG